MQDPSLLLSHINPLSERNFNETPTNPYMSLFARFNASEC